MLVSFCSFRFAHFVLVVSFRWFRFGVSGFSTCLFTVVAVYNFDVPGGEGGAGFVILVSDRGKRDRVYSSGVAGGGEGAALIILVLLRGKERGQGIYF